MEQSTSPVMLNPPRCKVNWRGGVPYVEVWQGDSLVIAGWVYSEPNMIYPPPMLFAQANIVTGPDYSSAVIDPWTE
jgi:hypothetical protein